MGDRLRAGIPSRYVTSQLGQLSLASFRGRLIEYHWGKGRNVTSVGWQVTLCDPIWHVSFGTGVAGYTANCYIRILYTLLPSAWLRQTAYKPLVTQVSRRC